MSRSTIVIVDDNDEFRRSAQWWLEGAGYAVQPHADPAAALEALAAEPPPGAACVLLDVRMPGMSGLEFHDRLRAQGRHWPVVYMSGHGDVPLAVQAMQKGAVTFLEKPFADAALEAALERAFGQAQEQMQAQAQAQAATAAAAPDVPSGEADAQALEWQRRRATLTPRERELLEWVLKDKLNKTIADLMGISIKTVELHRKRVMDKLGAASATHLMRMAVSGRVQ